MNLIGEKFSAAYPKFGKFNLGYNRSFNHLEGNIQEKRGEGKADNYAELTVRFTDLDLDRIEVYLQQGVRIDHDPPWIKNKLMVSFRKGVASYLGVNIWNDEITSEKFEVITPEIFVSRYGSVAGIVLKGLQRDMENFLKQPELQMALLQIKRNAPRY